jgi:hypothetical protein
LDILSCGEGAFGPKTIMLMCGVGLHLYLEEYAGVLKTLLFWNARLSWDTMALILDSLSNRVQHLNIEGHKIAGDMNPFSSSLHRQEQLQELKIHFKVFCSTNPEDYE